jgi:hypothetical protein
LVLTENQRQEDDSMVKVIKGPRSTVIAVVVAALLGAAALLSVAPTPASATAHPCGGGEFCLYFNEDANGGYYHFTGADPNLDNDHYVGGDTGEIVGDTSRYAFNAGNPGPKDDVVVYGLPRYVANGPTATDEIGASSTLARRDRDPCRSGPRHGGGSARFVRRALPQAPARRRRRRHPANRVPLGLPVLGRG